MKTRVVCFANRKVGQDIVLDLSQRREIELVAVVTNNPPEVDFNLHERALGVPVICWGDFMSSLDRYADCLDCGVSVLFRHYVPPHVLATFARGIVNLHPSFLPYGQGSYPATWAIWEQSPYGASAHLMREAIDEGPILDQMRVSIHEGDTSHSLYERGLRALWHIYESALLPWLLDGSGSWTPQPQGGSRHGRADLDALRAMDADLLSPEMRERRIRALTLEPGSLRMSAR